ncbi:MAG: hypothetical protein AAFX99_24230, partial [Myxococcota bacterium]
PANNPAKPNPAERNRVERNPAERNRVERCPAKRNPAAPSPLEHSPAERNTEERHHTERNAFHRALHSGLLGLFALTLLLGAVACQPFEHAVSDRAQPIAQHTCTDGPALLVTFDPVGLPLISCPEGNVSWDPNAQRWQPLPGLPSITAWLEPTGDREHPLIATRDGKLALLTPEGPQILTLPPQPKQGEPILYRWRPHGLGTVEHTTVVGLFEGDHGQLIAVSAGAGAWMSDDGGSHWEVMPWLQRIRQLDGKPPVELRDLVISDEDQIAVLHYPEGAEATYAPERLNALLADPDRRKPIDTRDGGGPRIANGILTRQRFKARFLPIGRGHRLIRAPGANGTRLWLMITHPTRHEMTRYMSRDWGESYIDIGYFNMRPLAMDGTVARTAIVGRTDNSDDALWIAGDGHLTRYALVELPGTDADGPLLMSLPNSDDPDAMVLARGTHVTAYSLAEVGADIRLLWLYLPLGILLGVGLVLAVRRMMLERRLRSDRQRQLAKHRVAWQEAKTTTAHTTTTPEAASENTPS